MLKNLLLFIVLACTNVLSAQEIEKLVYPVSCGPSSGSCVAINENTLLSCYHVADKAVCEVVIDGKPVKAKVKTPGTKDIDIKDIIIIELPHSIDSPKLKVREPVYGEEVELYGMRTQKKMKGIIVGSRDIALYQEYSGVYEGDSGGAVIAVKDKAILGVISAYEGEFKPFETPKERRHVYFSRSVFVKDYTKN